MLLQLKYIAASLLLIMATVTAGAQKKDSSRNSKPVKVLLVKDSMRNSGENFSVALDSVDLKNGMLQVENGNIYLVQKDSLFKRNDSLFKRDKAMRKHNEALFQKNRVLANNTRQTFAKTPKFRVEPDSVFKKSKIDFDKSARLFKEHRKLDSLRKLEWKRDTLRIKKKLDHLKSDLHRIKQDSVRAIQFRNKKLVRHEVECSDNAELFIENIGRKLIIKTADDHKIRLETVTMVEDNIESKAAADWAKVFNIVVAGDKKNIIIRKAGETVAQAGNNQLPGQHPYKVNFKSPVTVYVPASVKIRIQHRYNELEILSDVTGIELDLMNTHLKMKNAGKAVIKSRYGSVKAGTIKDADIDLLNCNFSSGDLEKLLISSKYSNISINNVDIVDMHSISDQYNIARAKNINGNKVFGQLVIKELGNSMSLSGSSADLQVLSIATAATTIKLDNKYADVKLPVQKLQNYSVQFDGNYSKVFTPFEKTATASADSTKKTNPAFTKIVGDVNKEFTAFVVNCASCSVDFR